MKRPLGLFVAAVLCLVGCKAPAPTVNPFIGRTRIPPPQTGAAGQSAAPPYYPNNPAPGAPPAYQPPAQSSPAPWPAGSVPPNYQFQTSPAAGTPTSEIRRSPEIRAQAGAVYLDEQVLPVGATEVVGNPETDHVPRWSPSGSISPAANEATIRVPQDSQPMLPSLAMPSAPADQPVPVIVRPEASPPQIAQPFFASPSVPVTPPVAFAEPRPNYVAPSQSIRTPITPIALREPAPLQPDPRAIEISELPRVQRNAFVEQPQFVTSGCTPVSYPLVPTPAISRHEGVPTLASAPVSETSFSRPAARYYYHRQYEWLSGKLEYSPISRQWKLRYIPIDGETDIYGGSVVIANAEMLGDLKPGDFVTVDGTLTEAKSKVPPGFAPTYHIARTKSSAP